MVSNIWVAAADNQKTLVESYINSGEFTPNSKDPNGYTPIHAAASYGHIGLLKYLINEKNGDINIQDSEGDTPLHHVEDLKAAKFLVEELHADYKIKNNDGLTAAQYIEEDDEYPEVVDYLKSLAHDKPERTLEDQQAQEFIKSLPAPGTIDGHEIRYTMENDPTDGNEEPLTEAELEERRKKIEAILNSENPEEALRELVKNAVHDGMSQFRQEQAQAESEEGPSSKRRKD
ncbi:ankyrin repeat-containing domain protein [Scheffersomyces xylosifermentans]|uniref:ankyrin repeat-containing domain protein n=1 Tax=Scheffersomyces xylosifermentans TaxID=1304137 RepID=UPI00315CF4A8